MGFTEETFRFMADLEANNSRDWFEAHRDAYEAHWKAPALSFVAGVSVEMAALSPRLKAEPRINGSLRRINRDARFSKDKSPYDARLHMVFWAGDHPNRSPGVHLVLRPGGVGYGAGQWAIEPAALVRMRARIAGTEGDDLIAAFAAAEAVGCVRGPPHLARLPKGVEAKGARAELLRYKGFVARTFDDLAPREALIGAGAGDWAMEVTRALMPLVRWLHA